MKEKKKEAQMDKSKNVECELENSSVIKIDISGKKVTASEIVINCKVKKLLTELAEKAVTDIALMRV